MLFKKKYSVRYSALVTGFLLTISCIPAPVAAQQDGVDKGLADFSIDLDSLPPQPTQSTLPEEDVSKEPELTVGTIETPAAQPSEPLTPMTPESTNAGEGQNTGPKPVPHSGLYYDSSSIVPSPSLGTSVGPRKVDPKYEPGSSFVVVRKSAGANSREAKIVAAQRALKLERYTSALEIYEELYKKAPKNKQILMGLAVAQQGSGFAESAIATYEELLKIDSKNTDATVNMLGLIKTQYPSVAYRKLRDLWTKNTSNSGIAAQLGLTSASMGNAEEALRYLGIAAGMEPQNASHFYNMAVVSDQAGAYKDAVDLYQKALEVDIAHGGGRSIPREKVYDRLANLRRL